MALKYAMNNFDAFPAKNYVNTSTQMIRRPSEMKNDA